VHHKHMQNTTLLMVTCIERISNERYFGPKPGGGCWWKFLTLKFAPSVSIDGASITFSKGIEKAARLSRGRFRWQELDYR